MSEKRSYEDAFVESGQFNVNNYKYDYELDHQWDVKRKFMLAHQEKYSEDRLICLAQIFCNVHFMGCRYDDGVMELIDELSKGIIDKNKKWEKVSFVAASNAVEERVRGRLNAPQRHQPQQNQNQYGSGPSRRQDFSSSSSSHGGNYSGRDNWVGAQGNFQKSGGRVRPNFVNFDQSRNEEPSSLAGKDNGTTAAPSSSSTFINFVKSASRQAEQASKPSEAGHEEPDERRRGFTFVKDANKTSFGPQPISSVTTTNWRTGRTMEPLMKTPIGPPPTKQQKAAGGKGKKDRSGEPLPPLRNELLQSVVDSGPFGKLVLVENLQASESAGQILSKLSGQNVCISYEFGQAGDNITCKLLLQKLFLSSSAGKTKKIAKDEACKIAIERLKETSFTVQVIKPFAGNETVDRTLQQTATSEVTASEDVPIDESNIGSKLLMRMGWSGGGLGKDEQGIEEPISASAQTVNRSGLGAQNHADLRRKVMALVENYVKSETTDDLIFSAEFSKGERKIIHETVMSKSRRLKTKSYGSEDNRRLVVSKKASYLEIVDDLLDCGGENDKYKLIPPKNFQNGMNAFR